MDDDELKFKKLNELSKPSNYDGLQAVNDSVGLFQQRSPSFPSMHHTNTSNQVIASKDDIVAAALNAHRQTIDEANTRIASLEKEVLDMKVLISQLIDAVNRRPVPKKRSTD